MKKKSVLRLLSISLCGVLAAASITAFAYSDSKGTASGDATAPIGFTLQASSGLSTDSRGNKNLTGEASTNTSKDETVYVLANADGSVQKVIVSDWLKNAGGLSAIKDVTSLKNVQNVKGNESVSINQGDATWDAKGGDVYYQGDSSSEVPVSVTVSYTLDGKSITPDELKGKSGHVTIRYEYQNHLRQTAEIGGKQESIYVPFAMMTGLMLDDDVFTNVEVKGGRLINEGDLTFVAGVAFPGLQENLKLDPEKIEIPDSLEIEADVTNFEISSSVIIATNEIFNRVNLDDVDSMDDLQDAIDQLTDAMGQLMDGSEQLTDGLNLLLEKSGELESGISQLADGSLALKNGANDLNNGAAQLQGGIQSLSNGLNTLSSNNAALNGGARQVFDTLLATARDQLIAAGLNVPEMTVENYGTVLNGVISSLDENAVYAQALATVTNAVNAQADVIREKVTAAVREQVTAQVTAAVREQVTAQVTAAVRESVAGQVIQSATGMDAESYQNAVAAGMISEENQSAVNAAIDAQMASDDIQNLISSQADAQMASENVQALISTQVDAQMSSENVQALIESNVQAQIQQIINDQMAGSEVQSALSAASNGASQVAALKSSLDSYNSFYTGLQTYTAGVAKAASGAGQLRDGVGSLKDGTQKLCEGTEQLENGMAQLKNSIPELISGITQLRDGSAHLRDGLKEFNEEGIQKLVNVVDGDLEGLVERLKVTTDASKSYRNFSGISDDMDGQVRFIYRLSGIEN